MRRRRVWAGIAVAAAAVIVIVIVFGSSGGGMGGPTSTATGSQTTTAKSTVQPLAPPGSPALPAPTGQQLGASVNILFNSRAFSTAQIDGQLAALHATGATIARSDALWELTEPTPPVRGVRHYAWGFDDTIVGALAAHGLEWLPIVDYTAPWDAAPTGGVHPPPASISDYAAFASALAQRYGPAGSYWRSHPSVPLTPVHTYEIWNEPDNAAFWSPSPQPRAYAELYALAREAIDAIDPTARVIVGGLAHPEAFLPAMIAAMPSLRGHIDGVAIHPYAPSPDVVLKRVRLARQVLSELGLRDVALYVTEFGWATRPPHNLNWAPPARRPDDISQTLSELGHSRCGIAAVVLYTWVTLERNPGDREDWFGISPPGGGGSADIAEFASGVRAAATPSGAGLGC